MTPPLPGSGPTISGYTWVRALGAGGFADVHLYRQQVPSRDVAVKVVRQVQDERGARELRREANAMASVAGHPAVVELYAVGTTTDGRPYLVMEYCPVADVAEQVRTRPMGLDKALDTMIRLCGGVEMLHRCGLVHRDIKPANIMMDNYGKPVLCDFGVASPMGALEPGALDGFSVLWAPPEQQDPRTHAHPTQDVWALAATTWTLLSGRSPFEDPIGENTVASIATRVRSGRMRALGRADAPAELEAALRAAMALDPVERTASAAELGRALQHVQEIMGRPVTVMELRDEAPQFGTGPGHVPEGGPDGTRLRGMPSVDADRTRLHSIPSIDFDSESPVPVMDVWRTSATSERRVTSIDELPEWEERARRSGARNGTHPLVVVALVGVGALVSAALVVSLLTDGGQISLAGGGSATPAGVPEAAASGGQPPVETPAPAPVSGLQGQVKGSEVVWTWREGSTVEDEQSADQDAQSGPGATASPEPGVVTAGKAKSYIYTATRPGSDEVTKGAKNTTATVQASAGQNCLEVVAVGDDGRQSTPVRACVQVP
ncbi:serine/threonine protein kinase [Schaalia sp. 19OD2882]|uniref:serine/threonine-protein kinase n=1 Tax=Schaalia sp. 19OD2882 TaxID=2794089 RepID=UPI001C1EEA6A|nr:serine/threonine-protein kinase [Schaalia sp. 19OD2882]QWW19815.1 serine/threonine protein kinase [Schaalia sp. 19OD2882]